MADNILEETKMIPKNQWVCDKCGELIESIDRGWLEWYHEAETYENNSDTGFRIVHDNERCMYNQSAMFSQGKSVSDMHLEDFTGDRGLVNLLSFIETKRIKDNEEFSEIIKRIHVSYYEEARQFWAEAEEDGFFEGSNEVWPYLPETSLQIIRNYGR